MKHLANSSQGLAAPILEQYISNTQSTVDPEAVHPQVESLEETQGSQVTEDGRTEGNNVSIGGKQGLQCLNETGHESYEDTHIRETGYQAELHPSQQGLQGETSPSQPNGFPTALYSQYQYPSQSQGYQTYPPRYSSSRTGFTDLGQTYPYASMMESQQYAPLPQYSSQPLSMSQTSQFPPPPMSAGQPQYASPPNAVTTYQAPIVQHVNMRVRAPKTETKKHQCASCPKFFLRPSSLETHKRTHTGEKPFYCRLLGCRRGVGGAGFNVRSNCVRHEKAHIEKGELPPRHAAQRGVAQPRL